MHVSSARAQFRLVLATLLTLPVLALIPVGPADAATAGPTGLSPDGPTVSGTPVLSWDRLAGATVYDVEVWDGQPGVGTKVTSVSNTVNTQWVPAIQLPTDHPLTWQVRGLVNSVESDWSQATFTRGAVNAPGLVSPIGGADLKQPGDPLLYKWTAVPGATSYAVDVSLDENFVSGVTTYTTKATQYSPNIIPKDGHYFWRVTATLSSGVKSDRSAVEDYTVTSVVRSGGVSGPTQLPVYPDTTVPQTVKDVVLDWNPIDGASSYKVQISTDSNFLTVVHSATVKSTRYSPTTTLDNDQYWWRVAPINADGYQTPWGPSTPTWTFIRRWPDQATLQYPADGATVGDPFYFQWSPVPLASQYQIQLSPNESFTPSNTVTTCSTVHTTYTPSSDSGDCWPGAAGTYYWRVIAYDDPAGIISETVNGQVHSFTYDPDLVTQLVPANGATVQIPTLRWAPFPNADSYKVTLTNMSTNGVATKTTVGTSLTWMSKLTDGVTYKWQVQPVFADGRAGAPLLLSSQPSFIAQDPPSSTATSPEPISSEAAAVRPPLLHWTPVAEATSYTVQVRAAGTVGWVNLSGTFAYPSGNDTTGVRMSPGTYEWQVIANGGANAGTLSSTTGTYTLLPFDAVGGYRAAITGTASDDPDTSCTAVLPAGCQNLRQTPVLRWDPVDGAATYKLTIAQDVNLTNPVKVVTVKGTNIWMNPAALPDANAGTAYFWDVLPCGPTGVCKNQTAATHQFNKTGLPVQLTAPADGATKMPNDITFTWQDYLSTLQTNDGSDSSLSTPARTEAKQYRIQVDDNADFSSPLDSAVVDQTTYTPYGLTYPEQPLYWRVQAIDGSGNNLPWSASRTVTKESPRPVLTSGSEFSGSIALSWDPLFYAKTYTVQVFAGGANPDIATPLQSVTGLKQNAYAPAAPLKPGDYVYRVRRADADGRPGAWSDTGSFTSTGSGPTLVSPSDGAEVSAKFGLFTWEPASGSAPVASWRIALARQGGSTTTVNTQATAYAPTATLPDGIYTWTVTAFDTGGNAIGTSSRGFVVASTVTAGTVVIGGNSTVGSVITIQTLTWNVEPDTIGYQWYRGSTAISAPAGTGPTYTVVAADIGKTIKLKVTGSKAGYNTGAGTFSNQLSATAGPSLVVVTSPSFTGTRRVGYTLTAGPGTWSTSDSNGGADSVSYQWLRNGGAIAGATSASYRLVYADAGRTLSVRVTAHKAGYADVASNSPGGTVAKVGSATATRLAKAKIKVRKRGVLYVTVTAPGGVPITGTLRVYDGSRLITSTTLPASYLGHRTIRLPRLKKGRHYLSVRYLGNAQLNPSTSARLRLRVVR